MQKIDEIIVKLELAENLLKTSAFMESSDADDCLEYVDQALANLREFTKQIKPSDEIKEVIGALKEIVWHSHNSSLFKDINAVIDKLQEVSAPTAIKEVIAILEKEEYMEKGEWTISPGIKRAIAKLKEIRTPEPTEFTKECRAHCEVFLRGGWTTQKQIKTIIKNVGLLGIEVRLGEARLAVKKGLEACEIVEQQQADLAKKE